MGKKIIGVIAFAAIAVAAGWNYQQNKQEVELSDLALENVEALARGEAWKEHLREMDELRHSVQNASYENKDPLLIYKLESYNLFKNMVDMMNRKTAAVLMRGQIPVREEPTEEEKQAMAARQAAMEEAARQRIAIQRAEAERRQDMSRYQTQKTDPSGNNAIDTREQQRQEPVRAEKRVGRNDPCPCGSGKKYKNCHGQGL